MTRPRRSVLYIPGSNERALEKGKSLPADAVILDLEDAVAPDAKQSARERALDYINRRSFGAREVLLRVNGRDTPWGYDDLVASAKCKADAILLPKVESSDDIRRAVNVLEAYGASSDLAIWCMLETPRGILRAEEIAGSDRRVAGFVMGTNDLAKDLQAAHTPMRLPMLTSLSHCLLVARAYNLAIIDGVFPDLGDEEGFIGACAQGAELGFDGKSVIHPKQLAAANDAFAPSEEAIAFARRIIQAHAEAVAKGQGVVLVDGKLIENLHVAGARRIVLMADKIKSRK